MSAQNINPNRLSVTSAQRILLRVAVVCGIALYAMCVVRTAWMSDDAFITLRTVNNFVNGYGLRWNLYERVQAYTHPLWMFVLSLANFFTREAFFTTLAVSVFFCLLTIGVITTKIAHSRFALFAALLLLASSKSYVEYSTSGLENPLSHFLLVLFAAHFLHVTSNQNRSQSDLFFAAFLAALITLNRQDLILMTLPALAYLWWQMARQRGNFARATMSVVSGLALVAMWMIFSLVYYGFLLPNTFYAKLSANVSWRIYLPHGLQYVQDSLARDPLTLGVVIIGILVALISRRRPLMCLAAGVALYIAYVVFIGGDFMSGRFFSAPFLMSVLILLNGTSTWRKPRMQWALGAIALAALLAGFANKLSPFYADRDYGTHSERGEATIVNGIADERGFYFQQTGLLKQTPSSAWNNQPPTIDASNGKVLIGIRTGVDGFRAQPQDRIIDVFALSDAFLARVPLNPKAPWRIGHLRRLVFSDYVESVASSANRFVDPELAEYYDALTSIISGDLFTAERWRNIWRMNFTTYAKLPIMRQTLLDALAQQAIARRAQLMGDALGKPIGDIRAFADDTTARYQEFEKGVIVTSLLGGTQTLPKDIFAKWQSTGATHSPLSVPIKSTQALNGGTSVEFLDGAIFASPATGAWVVRGNIYVKYVEQGAANSALGFPISDEESAGDADTRVSRFQRGKIFWTQARGAWVELAK